MDSEVSDVTAPQHNELDQTTSGGTLESTARHVHTKWADSSDRIEIEVGGEGDEEAEVMNQVFWTGLVHSLQVVSLPFSSLPILIRIFGSSSTRASSTKDSRIPGIRFG
jgi:hypothetical protein